MDINEYNKWDNLSGGNESKAIDKLSEISQLHQTILKLQKDIERLENNYNETNNLNIEGNNNLNKEGSNNLNKEGTINLNNNINSNLEHNLKDKKVTLDNISILFDNEIEKNKSILPDKNTIMEIINDIL